jgi:methionyl aminopeptidase
MVEDAGATSATIGYRGYQHASCISVNHVVCHGIPGGKVLKAGDILNIDVTVIFDGWFGDTSRMYRRRQDRSQGRAAGAGHP